jgi:aerobic-type carbon monoxide dehydrogenase small subunit (CoxS/CutS family)
MELYALLTENPGATEKELANALNKHLCRCTAYEAIWEGALLAQEWMAG